MDNFGSRAGSRPEFRLFLLSIGAFLAGVGVGNGAEKPAGPGAVSRLIDQEIGAKLAEKKLVAGPPADDATFLRRLYLDLHGTLPPADRAAAFLDDRSPGKRAKLIDELLAGEGYGRHQSEIWYGLLVPLFPTNKNKVETERLAPWLTTQFNENRPWNRMVYDMLTASGPTIIDNPALIPFLNSNTVLKPEEITDLVSTVFLGANLKCAQCHNHPFADWTRKDYWGTANFFTRFVRQGTGNSNIRGATDGAPRKLDLPDYAQKVRPKFLNGVEPQLDPEGAYRPAFAAWATAPENPFFARAMVNRTWAQLFGRGLVNPVDDVRPENASPHADLLGKLADCFVASGFDLKFLTREICGSETYQRSGRPEPGAGEDVEAFYGRRPVRVLTPHQLSNALTDLGVYKAKNRQKSLEFLRAFSVAGEEFDPLSYDRGIPPQLRLANSPDLEAGRQALARSTESSAKSPAEFVEQAYLRILSRRPTAEEAGQMADYIRQTGAPRAHDDIVWVLLNASEFTLIR